MANNKTILIQVIPIFTAIIIAGASLTQVYAETHVSTSNEKSLILNDDDGEVKIAVLIDRLLETNSGNGSTMNAKAWVIQSEPPCIAKLDVKDYNWSLGNSKIMSEGKCMLDDVVVVDNFVVDLLFMGNGPVLAASANDNDPTCSDEIKIKQISGLQRTATVTGMVGEIPVNSDNGQINHGKTTIVTCFNNNP